MRVMFGFITGLVFMVITSQYVQKYVSSQAVKNCRSNSSFKLIKIDTLMGREYHCVPKINHQNCSFF